MTTHDPVHERSSDATGYRRAERLSHALYGLIIVTATLVAERIHVTEPLHALGLLMGTAVVLLLAHTYSAVIATRTVEGRPLGSAGRRLVVLDNLPVLFAVIIPAVLFLLAAAEVMTLRTAYTASIAFSVASLFALGLYEGRTTASMGWAGSILSGAAAGAIGIVVVAVEAFFE